MSVFITHQSAGPHPVCEPLEQRVGPDQEQGGSTQRLAEGIELQQNGKAQGELEHQERCEKTLSVSMNSREH